MKELSLHPVGTAGILLASSLTIMVGSALTPALPEIGNHFGLAQYAGWLITTPSLGVVIGALFCGNIIKKASTRTVCLIGLLYYGLLGVVGCFMPSVAAELLDRFLLGIATVVVMTTTTALIAQFYHGDALLRMIAVQGMAIELGGVLFLSVGGYLASLSWQASYGIYLVAFLAFLLIVVFVPSCAPPCQESRDSNTKPCEITCKFCELRFSFCIPRHARILHRSGQPACLSADEQGIQHAFHGKLLGFHLADCRCFRLSHAVGGIAFFRSRLAPDGLQLMPWHTFCSTGVTASSSWGWRRSSWALVLASQLR